MLWRAFALGFMLGALATYVWVVGVVRMVLPR